MAIDAPVHTGEANLPRVLGAGLPVLLVFWRRDCAPCESLAPALDRLAKARAGRLLIVKVNASEEPGLAQRYAVADLPTLAFIAGGREAARSVGAGGERELGAWLDALIAGGAPPEAPGGPCVPIGGGRGASPGAGAPRQETGAGQETVLQPVVLTDATFDAALRNSRVPVLVDFWAEWCGPCKAIAPAVARIARDFAGRAVVAKLNVDESPRTASRLGIMSIPTLIVFRDGQVVDQIVGAQPEQVLRQMLQRAIG